MTRTPLPHDFGPMWREHNRRQHVPFWEKLDVRFVWACIVTCCVIFAVIAGTHSALAGPMPNGYFAWCQSSGECETNEHVTIVLTDDVHNLINQAWDERRYHVRYEAEETGDTWRYPEDGRGDCEDIAIWFRTYLEVHGIPRGAMRFAVGNAEKGRHAWLTVHTSHGLVAMDETEVALASEFHATADLHEICGQHGCGWRGNVIYPTRESIVAHTEGRE